MSRRQGRFIQYVVSPEGMSNRWMRREDLFLAFERDESDRARSNRRRNIRYCSIMISCFLGMITTSIENGAGEEQWNWDYSVEGSLGIQQEADDSDRRAAE